MFNIKQIQIESDITLLSQFKYHSVLYNNQTRLFRIIYNIGESCLHYQQSKTIIMMVKYVFNKTML